MLYTNLNHIETASQHAQIISKNQNVIIICGRMDYKSIMVYRMAEELQSKNNDLAFFDMEADNPETAVILQSEEITSEKYYPFILLYQNGKLLNASSEIQSSSSFNQILNTQFSDIINA